MALASSETNPSAHNARGEPAFAPELSSAARQELRDEGIQWEGQVLITGTGSGIPALLVLTADRLLLIANGETALEAPRLWLTPEPKLLNGNVVRLSITPLGESGNATGSDQLAFAIRDGRGPAAKLVTSISGRLVSNRAGHTNTGTSEATWGATGIGASAVLPPLPDFPDEGAPARSAWPPVEHNGVASVPVAKLGTPTATTTWGPAARPETTVSRSPSSSVPPDVSEQSRQFNRGLVWGLRTLILALLIGTAAYFGRDSLPADFAIPLPAQLEERFGLNRGDYEDPNEVSQLPGTSDDLGSSTITETPEPARPGSDGTSGAPNSDLIGGRDDSNGVGGANDETMPADIGNGMLDNPPTTAPPTQAPAADPTEAPAPAPTEAPAPEPTEPPAPDPTEPPAPDPTEVPPVVVPTLEPTQVPVTPDPTESTDVDPTEEPATEAPQPTTEPTEDPSTPEPTAEPSPDPDPELTEAPATEEPVEEPSELPTEEPAPTATIESQPPSVDPGGQTEQSLAAGAFRYTITGASRGESIPELPQINPVGGYGEWLVLEMQGENWSDTEQVFDMREFRLIADGEEFLLDVGNGWVGGLLGFTPAYGNTDAILWGSGEGHPFALTFLIPVGAEELTLVAGDQVIDLTPVMSGTGTVASQAQSPDVPVTIEATVVEVINGETIVIERNGAFQTVRYIGLKVPKGDDCYASEATAANAELVAGKTVRLERQSTDTDARGNWVRDVWVQNDDGDYVLASEALVSAGAAKTSISQPNTRFDGWLNGAEADARAENRGLWAACGEQGATTDSAFLTAAAPESRALTAGHASPRPD